MGERQAFFAALSKVLRVPGATVLVDPAFADRSLRGGNFRVVYPSQNSASLAAAMKPFVLLEVGSARVTPFVERDMTSFVHDELAAIGQLGDFQDNRPRAVRCVHPLVTLLEKLDALHRRVPRADVAPATFVRHFEDAAAIIAAERELPPLEGYEGPRVLAEEMVDQRQLARVPSGADDAFRPDKGDRFSEIRRAHEAIAPIFWGKRMDLDEACARIPRVDREAALEGVKSTSISVRVPARRRRGPAAGSPAESKGKRAVLSTRLVKNSTPAEERRGEDRRRDLRPRRPPAADEGCPRGLEAAG